MAEIVAKRFASDFREGTGEFEASGASTNDDERKPRASFGLRGGAFGAFERIQKFVANGGGFFHSLETGSRGAPGVLAVVGSFRTCGNDEGVVRKFSTVAKDDFFGVGIEIDGFAEKDFRVFLPAEDGAERRGDLAGRERPGGNLIEKRLEEMEVALVDEGDGSIGAFERLRGYQTAKTATENDNFMCPGHGSVPRAQEARKAGSAHVCCYYPCGRPMLQPVEGRRGVVNRGPQSSRRRAEFRAFGAQDPTVSITECSYAPVRYAYEQRFA